MVTLTTSRIIGWVGCDQHTTHVRVLVDDVLHATVSCDKGEGGNGAAGVAHTFVHRFPDPLRAGQLVTVQTSEGRELPPGPTPVHIQHAGHLDDIKDGLAAGWAECGGHPATLDFFADGVLIGRGTCSLERPDCEKRGFHPNVGFTFAVPPLPPTARELSVRFATGAELSGSPKPIPPVSQVRHASHKPITIVVGMHRSGTSLCANILQLLGVNMSEEVDVAQSNARGHWERRRVVEYHDRILSALGRSWYDREHALALPDGWENDAAVRGIRREMIDYLSAEHPKHKTFGFKDPRTSRMLPFWHGILNELNLEPQFIFCIRPAQQVSRSLKERDSMSDNDGTYRWLIYNAAIVQGLRGKPVKIIPYEDWFSDSRPLLVSLAESAAMEWPPASSGFEELVSSVIDPSLNHNIPAHDQATHGIATELYNAILESRVEERLSPRACQLAANVLDMERIVQPLLARAVGDWPRPVARSHSISLAQGQLPPTSITIMKGLVGALQQYARTLERVMEETEKDR